MYGLGKELLARAALSGQENRASFWAAILAMRTASPMAGEMPMMSWNLKWASLPIMLLTRL